MQRKGKIADSILFCWSFILDLQKFYDYHDWIEEDSELIEPIDEKKELAPALYFLYVNYMSTQNSPDLLTQTVQNDLFDLLLYGLCLYYEYDGDIDSSDDHLLDCLFCSEKVGNVLRYIATPTDFWKVFDEFFG